MKKKNTDIRNTDIKRADIELCFRALGLPPDASPGQVDKAYDAYMQRCQRQLLSADPGKRERTRIDMDLISDIHFRIRKSVTYADRLKMMGSQGDDGKSSGAMMKYVAGFACVVVVVVAVWKMMA